MVEAPIQGIVPSMGGEEASSIMHAAMASDAMRIPHGRAGVGCDELRPTGDGWAGELVQPLISHTNENMRSHRCQCKGLHPLPTSPSSEGDRDASSELNLARACATTELLLAELPSTLPPLHSSGAAAASPSFV
ncbi:hypothetical protein OsI_31014 [Oryza sativa Indica Group]|uniref:Uncharacterized protein n=1 Tax=Oryza sativa subsp. indica TaxID=39946 RepID=B8BER2_ORYSI|nr:hypothetical protein OsI_31014 [Oryza sativa Indica Group]